MYESKYSKMIKSTYFLIAFLLIPVLLNECNSGDKPGKPRKEKISVQKVYGPSDMLVSEITMKDGVRHGPTTNYYQSGKVQSVINFENGKRQGESVWYYEDGKPYQVTQYINDMKEGIQKKYYKSGKILAEVPFYNDEQQIGIKEYTETGELITDYPEIIFEKPVKTSSSGQFVLRMHLSDNSKEVVFEQRMINAAGDTVMAKVSAKEGIGEIPFFVEKGKSVAAQVQIRAKTRTSLKNIYVAERQYYVKIKN
jgi:antitoxin component YwqK of YwqJK toxin-antitoxin module